jgi:hypothetical protein
VLKLSEIMIPPLNSNTMSGEDILGKTKTSNSTENKETGRPKKADEDKSEKTIQNQESLS